LAELSETLASDAYESGLAAAARSEWAGAVALFEDAVAADPGAAGIWNDLGVALAHLQCHAKALDALRKGLAADPESARLWINLASCLIAVQAHEEAIDAGRRSVTLAAEPDVLLQASQLFSSLGYFTDGIAALQRGVDYRSGDPRLWASLGTELCSAGRIKEGIDAYRRALALAPQLQAAHSNLLFSLHLDSDLAPEFIADEHKSWGSSATQPSQFDFSTRDRNPGRKLHIGYLSSDLRTHSIVYFIGHVLELQDSDSFQVTVFANVTGPDKTTEKLRAGCADWHDVHGLSAQQCAELIYSENIDILIEIGGHTSPKTLEVLACKPAPVQISYLAYADTTGLPTVDYILSDSIADPPGMTEHLYSEKLLRLEPCSLCYRPPANCPSVEPRAACGKVVFGSFAGRQKLSPRTLSLWVSILRRLPDSELVLKARAWRDPCLREDLREYFARNGVDPSRLRMLSHNNTVLEHLAIYNEIDIALDTYPYGGITTTCEALWMGVPVVALAGRNQVSRLCASVLHAAGLPELVAQGDNDYIDIVVKLAANSDYLAGLKAGLRQQMETSPLRDEPGFSRRLHESLRFAWRAWALG
jgi:protein O-GlcNAc transferase